MVSLFLPTQDWRSIDLVYEDRPQSTEQILHSEKYAAREEPVSVELPDIAGALGPEWSQLESNTLEEFLLLAYLETGLEAERASGAAEGWGGDRYSLLKGPQDQNLVVSLIAWDSEDDALEFHHAFLEFMRQRAGGDWEDAAGDGTGLVMSLVNQSVFLGRDAIDILLIFAQDPDTLEVARKTVQGM